MASPSARSEESACHPARLLLARALLCSPELLLLDHLDTELDAEGRHLLQRLLETYRGTVVMATERPELLQPTHHWNGLA